MIKFSSKNVGWTLCLLQQQDLISLQLFEHTRWQRLVRTIKTPQIYLFLLHSTQPIPTSSTILTSLMSSSHCTMPQHPPKSPQHCITSLQRLISTIVIKPSTCIHTFKPMSKDTFTKYKKVRNISSSIMGDHHLYSKDGIKYMVKDLELGREFWTLRNLDTVKAHRYQSGNKVSYVYPLMGVRLDEAIRREKTAGSHRSMNGQNQLDRELADLLSRQGNNMQRALHHTLKYLLSLTLSVRYHHSLDQTPQHTTPFNLPLYLQLLTITNGCLCYNYDSWMAAQSQVVVKNARKLEEMFLSYEELKIVQRKYREEVEKRAKQKINRQVGVVIDLERQDESVEQTATFGQSRVNSFFKRDRGNNAQDSLGEKASISQSSDISLFSAVYKAFLLTLYLGSIQLNLRLYELGQFSINHQNLTKRLQHFRLRYHKSNNRLFELMEKVLLSKPNDSEEVKGSLVTQVIDTLKQSNGTGKQGNGTINSRMSVNSSSKFRESLLTSDNNQMRSSDLLKAPKRVTLVKKKTTANDENCPLRESISTANYNSNSKSNKNSSIILRQSHLNQDWLIKENDTCPKKDQDKILNFTSGNKRIPKLIINGAINIWSQSLTSHISTRLQEIISSDYKAQSTTASELFQLQFLPSNQISSALSQIQSMKLTPCNYHSKKYQDGSVYWGQFQRQSGKSQQQPFKQKNIDSSMPKQGQSTRHGFGIYLYQSGDVYIGQWSFNKMQGHGAYLFQSGEVYVGQLFNGRKEGYGQFCYTDGRTYRGYWKKDQKVGLGTVQYNCKESSQNINHQRKNIIQSQTVIRFVGEFKPDRDEQHVQGVYMLFQSGTQLSTKPGTLSQFKSYMMRLARCHSDNTSTQFLAGNNVQYGLVGKNNENGYHEVFVEGVGTISGEFSDGVMIEYKRKK